VPAALCVHSVRRLATILLFLLAGCGEGVDAELNPQSKYEKQRYIEQLGYSGDVANATIIAKYLEDSDDEIVMSASFYIGYVQGREFISELVKLLSNENPQIVNMAGSGLAQMVDIRDEWILPKLYGVLDHEFLPARLSAIEAIGSIGSPSSADILEAMFPKSSSGQKARIIGALGQIGDENSLPLLEAYLAEVMAMDHSVPNLGGARGVDLHPDTLQAITEEAIAEIKSNDA